MASKDKNLSIPTTNLKSIDKAKIAVVTSSWNDDITGPLRDACVAELKKYGCTDLISVSVPGAFELPVAAKMLLANHRLDAVICLGCVIKGETKHDEYISNAVAQGLMTLGVMSGKPVIFGVLTPNNHEQALDRAGGKHGNKGTEAAHTAIAMIHLGSEIKLAEKQKIGFGQ